MPIIFVRLYNTSYMSTSIDFSSVGIGFFLAFYIFVLICPISHRYL